MKPLARAAIKANREYLQAGLRYVEAMRKLPPEQAKPGTDTDMLTSDSEAD